MRSIQKIKMDDQDEQVLMLGYPADILSLSQTRRGVSYLYTLVDDQMSPQKRTLKWYKLGEEMPRKPGRFIGRAGERLLFCYELLDRPLINDYTISGKIVDL